MKYFINFERLLNENWKELSLVISLIYGPTWMALYKVGSSFLNDLGCGCTSWCTLYEICANYYKKAKQFHRAFQSSPMGYIANCHQTSHIIQNKNNTVNNSHPNHSPLISLLYYFTSNPIAFSSAPSMTISIKVFQGSFSWFLQVWILQGKMGIHWCPPCLVSDHK